jgi:ankyrin repeat protein
LWYAACRDDVELVGLLLDARPRIDAADASGVTPAACAAARGNSAVLERLARAGADLRQRDRSGDTLLMLAAQAGQAEVVQQLLAAGGQDLNAQNELGDTALILASRAGAGEVVDQLLMAGAKRALRNRDGQAAADAATARGFDRIASRILAT